MSRPLLLWLTFVIPAVAAWCALPPAPPPGEFLHDRAGILSPGEQDQIRQMQAETFAAHRTPIVVVTIESMAHYRPGPGAIESFAREWFDHWRIGSEQRNTGVLVLVSKQDRQARIELGKAWGKHWDGYAEKLMRDRLVPSFKQGHYGAGLINAVGPLARMIEAGPDAPVPESSAWDKFMDNPTIRLARENNPMNQFRQWTPHIVAVGTMLTVFSFFAPGYRRKLLTAGLGLIGLALFFWVAVIVLALMGGRTAMNSHGHTDSDDGGFDGGSSGGGGASGRW